MGGKRTAETVAVLVRGAVLQSRNRARRSAANPNERSRTLMGKEGGIPPGEISRGGSGCVAFRFRSDS